MKKLLLITLSLIMIVSGYVTASAEPVGTVIGEALHTDIVVYINNFAIPSYAVNGQSAIIAEDLRNFGFDVLWDQNTRSLNISRNTAVSRPTQMNFRKDQPTGKKFSDIFSTDITVFADGTKLNSYAMNGYTMIPIEELTMFGTITWNDATRALYVRINGMFSLSEPQYVAGRTKVSSNTDLTPNTEDDNLTPYQTLKKFAKNKGRYDAGNYYFFEFDDDTTYGIVYRTDNGEVSLYYADESVVADTVLITLSPNESPRLFYKSIFSSGSEYSFIGYFPHNKPYVELSGNYPSYLNPERSLNLILALTEIFLEDSVGLNLSDLGIYYEL